MVRLIVLFLAAIVMMNSCATSQVEYSTNKRRAIKFYEEAKKAPRENIDMSTGRPDFESGIELLQKAIDKDDEFLEAHQLLGEFYSKSGQTEKAVKHFKRALEIRPSDHLNGMVYVMIGELQISNKEFDDAIAYFDKVLQSNNRSMSKYAVEAARELKTNAEFAKKSMENPTPFEPKNIGPSINTEYPEYFPTLTVDGRTLLFTREIPNNDGRPRGQEDFFVSHLSDKNRWTKAEPMPRNINTSQNEGAPTISADGRTLIFVACADKTGRDYGPNRNGRGSCDLFVTKRLGKQWLDPQNLPGMINTFTWESQPSLSADGKTLYFVRRVKSRVRGQRRSDIFKSTKQPDGSWGKPEPLPMNINTKARETSVLIHPDGQTMYFSSNGHVGMGGIDIYVSRKDPLGNWGDPINLGYPINTENNENSLLVGPDGEIAFFASDRPGGYGDLDIYYFDLPKEYQPKKTLHFEGQVFDAISQKPLEGKFELIDVSTGEQVVQSSADPVSGEFMVALPTGREYALNVSYPGYAFFSKNFDMKSDNGKAVHMDVPLIPITDDQPIQLANVFFDLDKSTLREASHVELNKLVEFLEKHPELRIEIGGHTDTRGNDEANMTLSRNRAKSVRDYLVEQGLAQARLEYKGYGETQPIHTDEEIAELESEDEREAAHQENRRTEYKIMK